MANAEDGAGGGGPNVQEVLESMFSKKSLVSDYFLVGSMNPQMYVSVEMVAMHPRLLEVAATKAAIIEAASKSAKVSLNDDRTMIRPLLKSKRNVVILHDVLEGTSESEIRELIAGAPHADKVLYVKPEVNNTWFIKYDVDDTQEVVLWLRSKQLKGQPVSVAIKSDHFIRSFFPLQAPPMASNLLEMPLGMPMPGALPPQYWEGGGEMDGLFPVAPPYIGQAPGIIPPRPPMFTNEPQQPGFWAPWGLRLQPAPVRLSAPIVKGGYFDGKSKGKGATKAKGAQDWKEWKDSEDYGWSGSGWNDRYGGADGADDRGAGEASENWKKKVGGGGKAKWVAKAS